MAQEWIMDYIKDTLYNSPLLQEHLLEPSSPTATIIRRITAYLTKTLNIATPIVLPLLNRLTAALYGSPDIVVLGFILVILVLVFQILSWLRRALLFWTRIAFRMTFYAGLVGLAASVWQRGLEASWADAMSIAGLVVRYGGWLKDVWVREYRRYEEQGQKGGHSGRQAGWGGR